MSAEGSPRLLSPFYWSGRNSVAARHEASAALRVFLRQKLIEYPSADHYVIAHSHGGTVAFKALSEDDLSKQIRGLVCLSTPFLNPRRRSSFAAYFAQTATEWLFALGVSGSTLMLGLNWGNLLGLDFVHDEFEGIVLVLFASLTGIASYLGVRKIVMVADRWSVSIAKKMEMPETLSCRVLLVRTFSDEATGALVAGQFCSWLAQLSSHVVAKFLMLLGELSERRKWFGLMLTLIFLLIYWSYFLGLYGGNFGSLLRSAGLDIGIGCAFILLTALLSIAAAGVLMAALIGWEMLPASVALDVAVECTPPGKWEVLTIGKLSHDLPWGIKTSPDAANGESTENDQHSELLKKVRAADRLMHAQSHDDPQVIWTVTRWVEET